MTKKNHFVGMFPIFCIHAPFKGLLVKVSISTLRSLKTPHEHHTSLQYMLYTTENRALPFCFEAHRASRPHLIKSVFCGLIIANCRIAYIIFYSI